MTTAHLPECYERELIGLDCICDWLRACEKRVRARYSAYLNADNEGSYAAGFRDAMHAAREAVTALNPFHMQSLVHDKRYEAVVKSEALAAIDALRGER